MYPEAIFTKPINHKRLWFGGQPRSWRFRVRPQATMAGRAVWEVSRPGMGICSTVVAISFYKARYGRRRQVLSVSATQSPLSTQIPPIISFVRKVTKGEVAQVSSLSKRLALVQLELVTQSLTTGIGLDKSTLMAHVLGKCCTSH